MVLSSVHTNGKGGHFVLRGVIVSNRLDQPTFYTDWSLGSN